MRRQHPYLVNWDENKVLSNRNIDHFSLVLPQQDQSVSDQNAHELRKHLEQSEIVLSK